MEEIIKTICGNQNKPQTWIGQKENGMYFRTASFKGNKSGTPAVKILNFSDVHINYSNEKDIENDEIMLTMQHRIWNGGGISVRALKRAMEYGKDFDRIIVCGDVLDYMSFGAMELMDKYLWDADSNIIVTLGNHEWMRQMQTGVEDKTPIQERYAILEKYWRHNIYYKSEILGEKVMVIQMDNSRHCYWGMQVEKLERDIEIARRNDCIILIFQHDVLSTGKKEDSYVEALIECDGNNHNFYTDAIGPHQQHEATTKVYNLITQNADVIKGIFCGHLHSGYYTEIEASYKAADGSIQKATIQQYVMEGLVYNDYVGHVMEITVE